MHILLRGIIAFVCTSLFCASCTDSAASVSLALPVDIQKVAASPTDVQEVAVNPSFDHTATTPARYAPLKALNKNARSGAISAPEKSDAMYFSFEQSPDIVELTGSGLYALELELEPLADESLRKEPNAIQTDTSGFTVGLLYASDFSATGKLKENILPQHAVTVQTLARRTFTVSIGFAGITVQAADIRGFMVLSQSALKLKSAAIVPVRYGWLKSRTAMWYGTTADGGIIPPELCTESGIPLHTELLKPSAVIRIGNAETDGRDNIIIHFDETLPINLTAEQKQPRLSFQCGSKRISAYRAPNVYQLTLDGCLFSDSLLTIEQTNTKRFTDADRYSNTRGYAETEKLAHTAETATMVCGITAVYYVPSRLDPITTDPGLIPDWPQQQWRQSSYELFAWKQFPSVLIFDFTDYAVQDAYLKRLSFFAEKKGFVGKLLSDNVIASLHGFNAHDYRAETLAAFFRQAEEEHFPLNKSELHLRKILFHNGIVVRTESGIEAGTGAIVSISRQSPAYLRYRFITHEGLHGIYFTEENFRNTVAEVFQQTDSRAVRFLRRYFEVYPTLQYNTDDDYLLQNEFMAYLLQQGSSSLQQYYNRISWFQAMNEAEPALCRYMRETNAESFMQAATQMSSFLYTTWGLKGGRIHLAEIESL